MTTSTHETVSVAPVSYTDTEKAVYSLAAVEEWRTRQYSVLNGLREASSSIENEEYIHTFNETIENSLDEYLQAKGISENDPHYDTIRSAFRNASIDTISDEEWYTSAASRGTSGDTSPSGRDTFAENVASALAAANVTPDAHAEGTTGAEHDPVLVERVETLEAELAEIRELWASENAKRQGRFYSTKSNKREALREEYFTKVRELGQAHLALHDDYDSDEKNLIATTILFDEQEKLRELTTEKLLDTKVSKMIRWMNKGNTATRIAKGVGIGIVAGAAGSFLAGAVGAGIIAGGTVAATRFARGFALKDKDARGMDSIFGDNSSVDADADRLDTDASRAVSDNDRMNHIESLMKLNDAFEDDTHREQRKRRKAAGYGTFMIGAGALIGYGIHEAVEHAADANLTATHWLHDKWNDFWNGDNTTSHPGTGPHGPHQTHTPGHHPHVTPGEHLNHKPEISWADFSHNAHYVHYGEGWYETFQDLGIPQDHWADVLKDAGPKLHQEGWAYFDHAHNEWRISQPGKLPLSVLKTIAVSSNRDGFDLAA